MPSSPRTDRIITFLREFRKTVPHVVKLLETLIRAGSLLYRALEKYWP